MSYIDENGMTAFVQQDDLFEWGVLLEIPQDLAWCRG